MTPAEQADVHIELIQEELNRHDETDRRIFLGCLRRFLDDHPDTPAGAQPKQPQEAVMNDAQASAFEATRMTYGAHADVCFCDIPIRYLCWLADPKDSQYMIKSYLRSRRGRERIERDDS